MPGPAARGDAGHLSREAPSAKGRGGGTRVVDRPCPVAGKFELSGADDWARQSNGSKQGSIMMTNTAVSLPNRSIGRVSVPGPV